MRQPFSFGAIELFQYTAASQFLRTVSTSGPDAEDEGQTCPLDPFLPQVKDGGPACSGYLAPQVAFDQRRIPNDQRGLTAGKHSIQIRGHRHKMWLDMVAMFA